MKIELDDYFTFLKFQSVSSEPFYKEQVLACADWLQDYLKNMGFEIKRWETSGYPVLFATNLEAGTDKPTLLIYNHYDVQPVDPLELWESPPFEPTIKNGQVYARGAQDNKGQCFYVLQALKEILKKHGKFPINIKLCIEGEEECGSKGISEVVNKYEKELKADYLAIVDLGISNPKIPSITLGIRGLISMDVEVEGSKTDLHSGSHGGIAYNPIHALTEILAKLRDHSGKITIPGFYDDVKPLSEEEKSKLNLTFDHQDYQKTFGAYAIGGEKELSPLERNWMRPTLEVNGICGGYTGTGFKTVIPAKAIAKISCRLVPNQDPVKISNLIASFIEKQAPEGIKVKVNIHSGKGRAVKSTATSKGVQVFAKAFSDVFQAPCEFKYSGATIPIATELAEASQAEIIMLGLGLGDDWIHAPNEHFGIDRIEKGAAIMVRAIELLGS